MTRNPKDPQPSGSRGKHDGAGRPGAAKPGWADGLRRLYDDTVAEPLPDSFEDLLKRLDPSTGD